METDKQLPAESALKELHAYAKLLFLRSGRQFEKKSSYRELEDEISKEKSEDDVDSFKNIPLGKLDVDSLRREFLDRLSETVSSTKGGRYVVATHMFYWPDKVKVFIATNMGFVAGDKLSTFLGNVCKSLKDIAATPDNQTEELTGALWSTLLGHQSSRLNSAIVELRQIMKTFQNLLPQYSSLETTCDSVLPDADGVELDFENCLKSLARLLFNDSESDLERHNGLVSLSHAIYRAFTVEHFQALGRAGGKLRQAIGFCGRLQTSFHVLIAAARQLSGFDDLSLIPVVRFKTCKKTLSQEWSLAKTFHALNLQLNDTAINKLIKPPNSKTWWTRNKLLNDFSRLKSPTREVHAEIQLVIFVLSNPEEVANGKRFDYIGCSRYSCLLCSKFLHCFQNLKTRGCHGKLYNHSWTVPLGNTLGESHPLLSGAVMRVISWMRTELITSTIVSADRRLEVKESTIGDSLVDILGTSYENHQQSHAASEHLHRQRAENSVTQFKNDSFLDPVPHDEASITQSRYETLAESAVNFCASCYEVETTRRCSHCGGALFCGEICERAMSLSHLLKCNMRQVTSADYLYDDVLEDELPTDPQVRQDFWFDRCQNKNEESYLFGVFIGLIHYHPDHITREDLHQWRSDPRGNPYLVTKVVEKFEGLPESSRGGYFPWFSKNRTRFELQDYDYSALSVPSPMAQVQSMQARARKYLAPEDQCKDVKDLSPFAKMHCFSLYSMAVDNLHPAPVNRERCLWFDFGFVVSRDQHEERRLGSMYITMLFGSMSHEEYDRSIGSSTMMGIVNTKDPTCSFDEFWKAWEAGKLMTIFDKFWQGSPTESNFSRSEDSLLARLRVFLETGTPHLSIWRLRHFLAMEGVSVESANSVISRAARDYGFSEELDTRTSIELKGFYVEFLKKAEPLAIHRERMEGHILQFAESCVDIIPPRVKQVLQRLL